MTVKQKFTGDANELLKEYQKILAQQVKLEQTIAKTGQQQKKSMSQFQKGVTSAVGGLKNMVAGFVSMQAAAKLVTNEMELQRRLAEQSKLATISIGDSQAKVAKNIGDVNKKQFRQFLDQIATVQKESGFQSLPQLNLAASGVLSAVGGDQKRTIDILKAATPFFKDAPEQLAEFSSAMGDVMKVTQNPNAKQALGLMLSIQGQARFQDLSAFKNVVPSLQGAVATQPGVDPLRATTEAAALFAGIGQALGDVEGAITKTTVANLSANLSQVIADRSKVDELTKQIEATRDDRRQFQRSIRGRRRTAADTTRMDAFDDQIRSLTDQRKKEQTVFENALIQTRSGVSVLEKLTMAQKRIQAGDVGLLRDLTASGFKGSTKAVIRTLLSDPDSGVSQSVQKALGEIRAGDAFVDRKQALIESGTAELQLSNVSKSLQGAAERMQVSGREGVRGVVMSDVRPIVERMAQRRPFGERAMFTQALMARIDTADQPALAAQQMLQNQIQFQQRGSELSEEMVNEIRNVVAQLQQLRNEQRNNPARTGGSVANQSRAQDEPE